MSDPLRLPDGSVPSLYFVDLDGTLISVSSEKALLMRLVGEGILGLRGILRFAASYALHPVTSIRQGKGWNRTYLKGIRPADLQRAAADCALEIVEKHLRGWTVESIRELASAGSVPVLMSATLQPLAEGVASSLGIPRVVASDPVIEDGVYSGEIRNIRPWGKGKLELLRGVCGTEGVEPGRCAAAGDSWADRHVLSECGCSVAVCPDRKLHGLAVRNGWKIVECSHTRFA